MYFKQNSNDDRCLSVVAAMATGLKDVHAMDKYFMKERPPYSVRQFCEFLFKQGLACGIGYDGKEFIEQIDVGDSLNPNETIDNVVIDEATVVTFKIRIGSHKALFIVEDDTEGVEHAIYWNGKQVYDPNPMSANDRPLNSYKILMYYPILDIE